MATTYSSKVRSIITFTSLGKLEFVNSSIPVKLIFGPLSIVGESFAIQVKLVLNLAVVVFWLALFYYYTLIRQLIIKFRKVSNQLRSSYLNASILSLNFSQMRCF